MRFSGTLELLPIRARQLVGFVSQVFLELRESDPVFFWRRIPAVRGCLLCSRDER